MSAFFLILCLAGCLATRKPIPLAAEEEQPEMNDALTEEDEALKRFSSPSFKEIKRELDSHAILKHPSVIGLYPRGEEPALNEKRSLNVSRPILHYGPLCPEEERSPMHIQIGHSATLLIRNFRCPHYKCAVCGERYGICKMVYTYVTLRVLYNNPFGKPAGWTWLWRSYRVPTCCQCFM